jgi:hypothetical protein
LSNISSGHWDCQGFTPTRFGNYNDPVQHYHAQDDQDALHLICDPQPRRVLKEPLSIPNRDTPVTPGRARRFEYILLANRTVRENWRRRLGSLLYNLERQSGTPGTFRYLLSGYERGSKDFLHSFGKLLERIQRGNLIDDEASPHHGRHRLRWR